MRFDAKRVGGLFSSLSIASLRRLGQRRDVDILRTESHWSFDGIDLEPSSALEGFMITFPTVNKKLKPLTDLL